MQISVVDVNGIYKGLYYNIPIVYSKSLFEVMDFILSFM